MQSRKTATLHTPNIKLTAVKSKLNLRQNSKSALWFLAPSLIILLIFTFYPMVVTVINSLFATNVRGENARFVGLANYIQIFKDPVFIKSLGHTFAYVFITSILTIMVALLLARLVTQRIKGQAFFRTAFASTMGISAAVASILFLFLFNPSVGLVVTFLKTIGAKQTNLLVSPTGAMFILILSSVWMGLGFAFLNLLGALQSVPESYYEVAEIAGWSNWMQTWKITVPMISPTLFFLFVVEIIGKFKTFTAVDLITGGGPDNNTNFVAYKIYQDAFASHNFGIASSEAIVLTIVIAIATWIQFRYTERSVFYK
ncbi:carbohydrate ABC transporter permease [Agrilactobacillus fermenti]|uniref:carbohydrate ABC transporter permease n=1 Tax=Agrilactobacillus fermenti TaxID=2586909 RepID=UPI003A5C0DC7